MTLDPEAQTLLVAFAGKPALDFAQLTVSTYRAITAATGWFSPGDAIAAERT